MTNHQAGTTNQPDSLTSLNCDTVLAIASDKLDRFDADTRVALAGEVVRLAYEYYKDTGIDIRESQANHQPF